MSRTLSGIACVALACLAPLGLAACGDDGDGGDGGSITAALTSFPDYLDPALSYTQDGWQTLWAVYTPLLTYEHAAGARGSTVVPGLAEAMPDISADGRTYQLTLRRGLRYSDGSAVKASDFEHAIKRVLSLESGGSSFYLGIVGAQRYVEAGKKDADIPGISADDRSGRITIKLDAPDGRFPYILAMPFASLVPGDTPFENETKDPPPGVGAYRFQDVRVSRGYDLVKVPSFDVPGQPAGKLDRISVEVVKNRRQQTEDVIRNGLDVMTDPPAPDQLRDVRARYSGKRYAEFPTNSTYFYFLNERIPPFDDVKARQAVNYAIDKRAIVRLYGGLLEPGCNFLPPGVKGYEKLDPCPWGDPTGPPDIAKAKRLVAQAGVAGQSVTVFGPDEPESQAVTEYLADVLERIGFKPKLRIVDGSVYFQTIGKETTKAQAGFTNWYQDFPHPGDFLFLVDGTSIQDTNNPNVSNVDDPKINAPLHAANRKADIDAVASQYASIDRTVVEGAHNASYGVRKLTVFSSDRIDFANCVMSHPVFNLDLTKLCLK